jgi:hypothetical protein
MKNKQKFPFAVFCERGFDRDRSPESFHKSFETAEKASKKYEKQFFSGLGRSNALISYSVYERTEDGWIACIDE